MVPYNFRQVVPRTVTRLRRGIYLLPNLLTTGALFSGFYSIVAAMNQQFESAAIAIFIAMILLRLLVHVHRIVYLIVVMAFVIAKMIVQELLMRVVSVEEVQQLRVVVMLI